MSELMTYLNRAVTDQASDIFLVAGGPVSLKLEGRICPIDENLHCIFTFRQEIQGQFKAL